MTVTNEAPSPPTTDEAEALFPEARRRRRRIRITIGVIVLVVALGAAGLVIGIGRNGGPPTVPAEGTRAPNAGVTSFLSLAKRGLSGSFSEVYRISHQESAGTVDVAQQASPGRIPFVTGPGTWSFLFQNQAGYSSQWIEKGPMSSDCWRPPGSTEWTCSGPGQFRYVNGYLLAIAPYVPGQFLGDLNQLEGALTGSKMPGIEKIMKKAIEGITFSRSDSPRFGPLECMKVTDLTTCLDRSGVVVSQRYENGASITLLSHSSVVPRSAFTLKGETAGGTFVALHSPYVVG